MKPKIISKQVIICCLVAVFCLSATILSTSCGKQDYPTASQQRKINKKLPYLEFNSEYTGIGTPNKEDWEVIVEAQKRMKIIKTKGIWQMNIRTPKDANISPEVFEFFRQAIKNTNSFNKQHRIKKLTAPVDPELIIR